MLEHFNVGVLCTDFTLLSMLFLLHYEQLTLSGCCGSCSHYVARADAQRWQLCYPRGCCCCCHLVILFIYWLLSISFLFICLCLHTQRADRQTTRAPTPAAETKYTPLYHTPSLTFLLKPLGVGFAILSLSCAYLCVCKYFVPLASGCFLINFSDNILHSLPSAPHPPPLCLT